MNSSPAEKMSIPKVVMVIAQFYPLLGGAEVQAQRLAASLKGRGVEIFVLTRRMKKVPAYEMIDGIPVYRSIRTVGAPFLFGLFYIASVFLFLYRKRNEYTIIHCNILQEYQTLVAIIIKLLFKKRVVAKMSSSGLTSDLKLMKSTLAGKVSLRFLRKADRIVSLCSQATSELLAIGIPVRTVQQIPNGVDSGIFIRNARNREAKRQVITFIGRLDSYKGVNYLLEAFHRVISGGADAVLTIIGNGPDEVQLRNQAAKLHILERVLFKGRQENIAAELSATDIFVLPSLSEGMSNVLLEAMACGLPVVATAVGGSCDMIQNRINGILVPPCDPSALCDAMLELLGNDTLAKKLANEARKTVEERYSLAHITDCYLNLYRELSCSPAYQEIII